jgi:hypothetical protein
MAASSKSLTHALRARVAGRRWLCTIAVLLVGGIVPASASAATTPGVSPQAAASITDATTGLSDASSLVPRDVCSAPAPGQAGCLAQYLALGGTRTPVHPRLRRASSPYRLGHRRARAGDGASPLAEPAAATAPQAGTPAYLRQAYDLSYLSQTAGTNQTVAIVDAYDDPTAEADLAAYRSKFSLPACTTGNGCFQKVDQNGAPINSGSGNAPPTDNAWDLEISLDLDAVSAICPNCHILLVEATGFDAHDMRAAQQAAESVAVTGQRVVSDSWRILPTSASQQTYFENGADFAVPGIATVAASGDTGYVGVGSDPDCNKAVFTSTPALCNSYPAAAPDVTAVGGTTLAPASGARGFGESAWSKTGSGCDTTAAKPTWQTTTDCSGREYNDISANGDPATGIQVYDSSPLPGSTTPAGWVVVGGTSEAASLVAAYYALVQSSTAGSTAVTPDSSQWPYANSGQLNDPSTGSNGSCPALSDTCNALPRYDGPTGAGSISGAAVTGAPGIGGPGPSGSDTRSVSSNGAHLQGGVYRNGRPTTYWWEYGTTTAYGQHTAPVSMGTGTTPIGISGTLTGLAPSTTYHYRLVAENSVGIEAGYDFTFTTLAATPPSTGTTPPPSGGTPTPTPTPAPAPTPTPTTGVTKPAGPTTSKKPVTSRSAPSLGKLRIVALGASTATASATLNPHGGATNYYLAYGTTRKLVHRASSGASTSSRTVTWHLRGLAAGKVYRLQAVATNAGGAARSAVVRIKTSAVSVGKIITSGGRLAVLLRCHGPGSCRVRLWAKAGGRLLAAGIVEVRGNRKATVLLRLNQAAVARASHGNRPRATLSAVSTYNGYAATVTAKFRLPPLA